MRHKTVSRYAQARTSRAAPTKPRHRIFTRFKHLVFTLLILISAGFTGLTLRDYQQSLDWSKNKNGLKMAQMPPDMLQDSPQQIAIKENFLKRADRMMAADGQIHITKSDLVALQADLQKIKTAKPQYTKRYQRLAEKYRVRMTLQTLTKNKTVMANPQQVQQALTTVGPILNVIHQKHPHDKFVAQEMQTVHNLNHDMRLIKQLLNNMTQLVVVKQHTATFKPQVIADNYAKAMQPQDKLVYRWSMLVPLVNLDSEIKDVLADQEQKINLYHDYRQDLQDKNQAYEDLRKARATHAANNAQVIERIREEKLAKQRQKAAEEAERKRAKERAKRKKRDTDDHESADDEQDQDKPADNSSTESSKNGPRKPRKKPKDHYIDPDQETAATDAN